MPRAKHTHRDKSGAVVTTTPVSREGSKSSFTLILHRRFLPKYRRHCRRWEMAIQEPFRVLGEKRDKSLPSLTEDFGPLLFIRIPGGMHLDELRQKPWARVEEQPIASILGEHGTSTTPSVHGPRRLLPHKPVGPDLTKGDAKDRIVHSLVGGITFNTCGHNGNRIDPPVAGIKIDTVRNVLFLEEKYPGGTIRLEIPIPIAPSSVK